MIPVTHYEKYGAYEQFPDGSFINPSNGFDANAYYAAKLLHCRHGGFTVMGHTGMDITLEDVVAAMVRDDLPPISHFMEYGGAVENIIPPSSSDASMVQGNWVTVRADGSAMVVGADGAIAGVLEKGTVAFNADGKAIPPTGAFIPWEGYFTAEAGQDSVIFYQDLPYAFRTGFGEDGLPGVAEVQKIVMPTLDFGEMYTLTVGSVVLESVADTNNQTYAGLVNLLTTGGNAAAYAAAPFTLSADGTGIIISFKDHGPQTVEAKLTMQLSPEVTASVVIQGADPSVAVAGTSILADMDTITGFNVGTDHILAPEAVTELVMFGQMGGNSLSAVLNSIAGSESTNANANEAGLFKYGAEWYLFVNNENASFSPEADIVIKLAGLPNDDAAHMTVDTFITA